MNRKRRLFAIGAVIPIPILLAAAVACESSVDLGQNTDAGGGDPGGEDGALGDANGDGDGGTSSDASDALESEASSDGAVDAGPKRIFITRATYEPDFGGITAGDFRCQSSATAAGFAGKFKAWLSDSQTDAADRFLSNGPWVEVGSNVTLFPTRASLRGYPLAQIKNDELGETATDRWWTGTLANGVKATGRLCVDWTSKSSSAGGGITGERLSSVGAPGKEWTESDNYACNADFALLCLED